VQFEEGALEHLVEVAGGDARSLLNALELAVETSVVPDSGEKWPPEHGSVITVSLQAAEESIQRRALLYDRDGDYHYDTISAFIKSVRGSDPDASLYWLAKMVRAGEDPAFIFRRMIILAMEDVGLADPTVISTVISCAEAFDRIGFPEGNFALSEACLCLATAPKSVQAMYESFSVKRSPVEWAFYHLLDYPQISVIISGMTTLEQLKDNIEIFSRPDAVPNCLSQEEKELLTKVRVAYDSMQAIPCTACEYCMPCKQNVPIAAALTQYNDGIKFENFDQPRRSYWFSKNFLGMDAGRCTACGECEPKCPQGIDIIKKLKVAHEALDGWVE
jgi:NAD-dependent dihydropyrimidine dehydrogenase PreA subunit